MEFNVTTDEVKGEEATQVKEGAQKTSESEKVTKESEEETAIDF